MSRDGYRQAVQVALFPGPPSFSAPMTFDPQRKAAQKEQGPGNEAIVQAYWLNFDFMTKVYYTNMKTSIESTCDLTLYTLKPATNTIEV